MSLSGPILAVGNVKSFSILAAFLASDLRLCGIGVFTMLQSCVLPRKYQQNMLSLTNVHVCKD